MMNNQEIERKMNFIVEQQAQFAADIQQLQESQGRTDRVVSRTAEVVAEMGEVVTRLAVVTHAGFNDVNAKIDALVDAQMRAEEHLTRTEATLSQSIAQTNENLNRLIMKVDRYRSGREGM